LDDPHDPRLFLASLFRSHDVVWTGAVWNSGRRHADHWRTVAKWQTAEVLGPMVSPAIWQPGTVSRTAANVAAAPFTVLDFDEMDGRKPETPAEIEEHVAASLALVRWLREGLRWQLAGI